VTGRAAPTIVAAGGATTAPGAVVRNPATVVFDPSRDTTVVVFDPTLPLAEIVVDTATEK
jgi:hypothetical protein